MKSRIFDVILEIIEKILRDKVYLREKPVKWSLEMKKKILIALLGLVTFCAFATSSHADYIHSFLEERRSCKGGAITTRQGYVVLSYDNGYAYSGIPISLGEAIKSEIANGFIIDDVCLTEGGKWLILGDNIKWDGIPDALVNKIRSFLNNRERINCVCFNDYGDWIVITEKYYSASDQSIEDAIEVCKRKYGFIRTASMSNYGYVIVAEYGFVKEGTIPDELWNLLSKDVGFDINVVKFNYSGSYLISDGNTKYWYSLK